MSDSPDGKSSAAGPRAIPAGPGIPRPMSRPPGALNNPPPGVVAHRPTTRMTADEIAAVIAETDRARGDAASADFDPEKTMVLDPVEDAVDEPGDESPTADYDPRARGVQRALGGATPPPPPAASADALRADGTKRRSSRRTVKIPDDAVNRPHPSPGPPGLSASSPQVSSGPRAPTSEPPTVKRGSVPPVPTPRVAPEATVPVADAAPPTSLEGESAAEETMVLRPMRIISIGSDPPPPFTTAVAPWPPPDVSLRTDSQKADSEKPPSSAVDTVRANVESATRTDLLPPPAILEEGWTPAAPFASPGVPSFTTPSSEAGDEEQIDVEVETADAAAEDQDLLEDLEPDAAPIPAKKPPPPPSREARAKTGEATETKPPEEKPKPKPWFEDVFSEDYIRTIDILPPDHVRKEVDFIEESLGVEHDGIILDLACGRGEHAVELALRGYSVVGVDLSPVALAAAHDNLKQALAQRAKSSPKDKPAGKPSFLRADMRALDFEENFDGAYCWSTSFGYFDDETNLLVLKRLHRALRQGGMLLIDVVNRDFVAPRSPSLVWFEGDGCVCMDDMCVDFLTSRLKVKRTAMFEDGHSRELEYSIRLYSLDTLGKMLREVGFRVVEVTGLIAHPGIFFGSESPRLIVLAERA